MAKSTFFRSEEMSLVQIYIPVEIARTTVSRLGDHGLIQFRDLNPSLSAFQRAFTDEIKKLNDLERQLIYLSAESEKSQIPIQPIDLDDPEVNRSISAREIDELQEILNEREGRVNHLNESYSALLKQRQDLIQHRYVVEMSGSINGIQQQQQLNNLAIPPANHRNSTSSNLTDNPQAPLVPGSDLEGGEWDSRESISFVAGVIPREKIGVFERVLWRTLRGNLFMNQEEIEEPFVDPESGREENKNVFIIFAHGQQLINKIKKTADAMGAALYPVEEDQTQRSIKLLDLTAKIEDLNRIIQTTNETGCNELEQISAKLPIWTTILKKEKAIYHILNLFNYDPNRKALIAEGWCPTLDLGVVRDALKQAADEAGSPVYPIVHEVSTRRKPPTFHRTNKFTEGFQNIVDSYGVATYREVNPGLFTVITFPFLFAVMFGDFGHGIFMFLAALYLCLKEKQLKKFDGGEIFHMMFGGRYIILLMGLFSIYTGLIYNDLFSKAVAWFPSGFKWPTNFNEGETIEAVRTGTTYAFGMDYMWHGAENYLIFTNSYKMKMSVIFGVIQMTFGIALTNYNHVQFNHKFGIWAEFIPQVLFLLCIFGYLCVTIIYKWLTDWSTKSISPPSLLNMLIYMFLSPGSVDESEQLFPGQGMIQLVLLLVAVICVPWMLLSRPLMLKKLHKQELLEKANQPAENAVRKSKNLSTTHLDHKNRPSLEVEANNQAGTSAPQSIKDIDENSIEVAHEGGPIGAEEMEEEEPFDFADVMIHQIIHTIEFCLGCISNTASYLRLWALSLAHNQLSAVLWEMVLDNTLNLSFPLNAIGAWAGFAVWFILTIGILLIMEGLSAFLHALRLHWVEFNNKFYAGGGYKFTPFSFQTILQGTPED
ncbi:V0/A0 complex, 116-kDa subunit of ATPase [Basidiobolus meristosporus CBS 931.73]|uniref:V-type proton ATPase subunit a n=1 Tax=Basidiobolus meristosporus CBS 931.73 TaxID=1314790 RepID=A0A1Y1XP60_9FUNG|nr:V0/A0 complex, 116-kDa subunit of ATPase [Basidiobolus meristosporus CBS 931.73]|eukprot:ORX87538.1 V0/A0 complex, 116-kDa subunit of ATPase [Basidiobolus meristosporus CBS 931.73]